MKSINDLEKMCSNSGPRNRSFEKLKARKSSIQLKSHKFEEFEEDDHLFTKMMINYAEKAENDHLMLKEILCTTTKPISEIFNDEKKLRLEFLKDPSGWMREYNRHTRVFAEDDHYLGYMVGLLEIIVNSSPYGEDKDDIYVPILLLQKMVSVRALKERRDPMRTALKLQHHLQEYAKIENDKNCLYDRKIEELVEIPSEFALTLLQACITPLEVTKLMRLEDETMFIDVLKSNNQQLVASKLYQKVVWQSFWGSAPGEAVVKSVKLLSALKRLMSFFFWNVFYMPLAALSKCSSKMKEKRKIVDSGFFSPFTSYLADLLNYTILVALLLIVTLMTIPDPKPVHLLIDQLKAGNITIENNPHFKAESDGSIVVRLPNPTIPMSEWSLWACVFARALTEWYQAYHKKGSVARAKLMKYFNSFSNLNDIMLMILLLAGMYCKLHAYIASRVSGVYQHIDDKPLVPRRLILTIYLYSTAAVMAMIHLLEICTVHVPGLGPLLRAIRKMFSEISRVIFLFGFFLVGFIVPMLSLASCYRMAYRIDGVDDDNDFHSFETVSRTVLSLIWSLFDGMSYGHKNSLYNSLDGAMTVFMGFLLVLYEVLLCIMCMNLLIAIMCDAYSKVNEGKFADWRFSQFESIMEYNSVTNVEGHGMPFLFPFSIPYMIFSLITKPCKKRHLKRVAVGRLNDNHFARFLCHYRKIEFHYETDSGEVGEGEKTNVRKRKTSSLMKQATLMNLR